MEKNIFNVGDKVRVVKDIDNKGLTGKIATVKEIEHNFKVASLEFDEHIDGHDCFGITEDGHGWNVYYKYLELANKFKVGDKVCVTRNTWSKDILGKVATVKRVDDDGELALEFEDFIDGHSCRGDVRNGYGWHLYDSEVELVEHTYKIGDRVKIVNEVEDCKGLIGKMAKVKYVHAKQLALEFDENMGGHSCMEKAKRGHGWYVDSDKVQLVVQEEQTTQKKEKSVTKYVTIQTQNIGAKIIFNGDVTIAILKCGTKGIAKRMPEDDYDAEKGVRIAVTKALIKKIEKKLKQLVK